MTEDQRREIISRQIEGMRALSEEEIAKMQIKCASGLRAMTNEEIAKAQHDGCMNSNSSLGIADYLDALFKERF